jgi:hypothetical protein
MYNRSQNENGTYNTRCLYCFMTVASAVETSEELDGVEARHFCPERVLADLFARQTATQGNFHLSRDCSNNQSIVALIGRERV